MKTKLMLFLFLLSYYFLSAQNFTGSFLINDYGDKIILELVQDSDNRVTGTMSSQGIKYHLDGEVRKNEVIGYLTGEEESLKFVVKFVNDRLQLTLFDPAVEKSEYDEHAESWLFEKMEEEAVTDRREDTHYGRTEPTTKSSSDKVVINGRALTDNQISEMENIYSVKPLPGNYWYDSYSDLYGVVGYPAYGFMFAGHDFGKMDENASNGDTGVFVNGRELPQLEWMIWSQLLGYYIQPGRYWLDENGNAGYEGYPIATDNLYAAVQRNYYSGSGAGGGDNIWSSRFSAGNYDQGNERGYVSVPGYGPVGYGF